MEYIVPPNQLGIRCNHPPLNCPLEICPLDGCGVYICVLHGCGLDNCGVDGCGSQCSGRGGGCSMNTCTWLGCAPGVN